MLTVNALRVSCGCRWEHYDMMPGNALAVEVWNGHWRPHNQEALQWFYHWLKEGYRLTAVSGTDMHWRPTEAVRNAMNVVYAQELSERAIIAAIKAGRSYISAGPEVLLTATAADGQTAMIGDTLVRSHTEGANTTIRVRWKDGHEGDESVGRTVMKGMASVLWSMVWSIEKRLSGNRVN